MRGTLPAWDRRVTDRRLKFVQGDIGTPDWPRTCCENMPYPGWCTLPAESHVDRSIAGPDLFLHTNVLGTHQSAESHADGLVGRAGGGGPVPGFTTFPPTKCTGRWILTIHPSPKQARYRPSSPYAASKAASDHLVRAYHRTYGLPITISELFQQLRRLPASRKVDSTRHRAMSSKASRSRIYGDGLQVRDWLQVHDHCRAVERVLLQGQAGETYNVGGQSESTNIDLVRLLLTAILGRVLCRGSLAKPAIPPKPGGTGGRGGLAHHPRGRPARA